MAFSSRPPSARAFARAALLPALPPLLRLCLGETGSTAPAVERTARDLAALDAGLPSLVEAWVRTLRESPDLTCTRTVCARDRLVAAVDRLAAEGGATRLHDLAVVVLALSTATSETAICARLAARAWKEMDDLWRLDARVGALGAGRALWHYDVAERADLDPDPEQVDDEPMAGEDAASRNETLAELTVDLRAEARMVALGLSALAVGHGLHDPESCVCGSVLAIGRELGRPLETSAASRERALGVAKERRRAEEAKAREDHRTKTAAAKPTAEPEIADPLPVPVGHVLVCPRVPETGADRGRGAIRGYEGAIGRPLPLIPTPELAAARAVLVSEYPHARTVVDRVLAELVGRPTIRFAPLLLLGPPGCGKSRFVRRLAEMLGLGLWRVDGARDTGASIAGLDRRWSSTEPNHPFMAISRYGHANPMLLIDEIDKAPTRTDYGRLWDGLLALLEPENASRYMDPCLQVEVNVAHVSYLCTANDTRALPGPLLDRVRTLEFPAPRPSDLDALLPALVADCARGRDLDPRWMPPLTGTEKDLVRRAWRGGSVRRLRRLVETILQAREVAAPHH